MQPGHAAYGNAIFNVTVPGQLDAVGQNAVVGHGYIMSHVRAHQKPIVIAYLSQRPAQLRARMNRNMFAENVVVADDQLRLAAEVFQILRRHPQHHPREKLVAPAQAGLARYGHVIMQVAAVADHHLAGDIAMRTDINTLAQFGALLNTGSRMNRFHSSYFRSARISIDHHELYNSLSRQ